MSGRPHEVHVMLHPENISGVNPSKAYWNCVHVHVPWQLYIGGYFAETHGFIRKLYKPVKYLDLL